MSSGEDYLDDILKSFMSNEDESNHLNTEDNKNAEEDNEFAIEDFGVEEPDGMEPEYEEEPLEIENKDETSLDETSGEEEFSLNDFAIQEPDLDELNMGNADSGDEEEELLSLDEVDKLFEEGGLLEEGSEEEENTYAEESLKEPFEETETEDEDLAEISGLLNAGGNDSVDDDMLALLESMSAEMEEPDAAITEGEQKESIAEETEPAEEEALEQKEKKSLLSKFFKKKEKKESSEPAKETKEETASAENILSVNAENIEPNEENTDKIEKVKKQNFLSKFLSFLTETDEDEEAEKLKTEHGLEPSDENRNILEELDEEDKKKKKKKVKGKNKGEKAADGEEDGEEVVIKETKKKKEKKKKKKEEDVLTEIKPEKKVSKKNIAVIAGLGVTLTAVIVVLCSIVPGFFDKRAAREAYYESDYAKSYELLNGKKLDNSDSIIYNKSKIIMELNRKLSSYHNYMSMGKEVQALDALMTGVLVYPDIYKEAETYHVTQEVSAIYETLLNILNDKYFISEEIAKVINAYEDDLVYTKKLESIVYGTPFIEQPESGQEIRPAVSDVLAEEEAVIGESEVIPQPEETNRMELEEELPDTAENTEELPEETTETVQPPAETPSPDTDDHGQGQLIQGLQQPINVEIHAN